MSEKPFCTEIDKCPIAEACQAYGNCSKREQVITRSTDEWSNLDTKKRAILYARGVEKRLQRQHYGDHSMIGHRHEPLIQSCWLKLLEGKPPRSLEVPLLDYFITQLDTERNRIRRLKENTSAPTTAENSHFSSTSVSADKNDVSDLNAYRAQRTEYLLVRQLQDLYDHIVSRNPELKGLLELYLDFGSLSAKEQALMLECSPRQIYYMRSKLEESIIFCQSVIEGDEP